jgi:hypothetical protein
MVVFIPDEVGYLFERAAKADPRPVLSPSGNVLRFIRGGRLSEVISDSGRLSLWQALTLDDEGKDIDEDEEAAAAERLTGIYERMKEIGADSADARASKILAGLGFDPVMQVSL